MAFDTFNVKAVLSGSVTGTEQFDRFGTKLNSVGKTADNVNKQMAGLQRTITGLASALGGAGLAATVAEFARVTIQIDAFQKQLSIGFGQFSTIELEKLRDTMRGLGIAQDEALGSAVRFTSALKLSGQTMFDANKNFEAASKLITANKLSADGANRVYYAMAQIASKGKLMSEELSGQLAENLAGIREQVAQALGMSSAQLIKQMEDGKVSADMFFEALQKIGGGIDTTQLDSAAMSLGKVKNAWFDFKTSMIDVGVIKTALDLTASALNTLRENAELLSNVVKGLALGFAGLMGVRVLTPVIAGLGTAFWALSLSIRTYGVATTLAVNGTLAMAAAARGLAMIFSPLNIAITAIVGGLYLLHSSSQEAEDRLMANAAAAKELGIQLSDASQKALQAATENRGVGSAAAGAEPAIWSYKNSVDNLTVSLYEQAKAARAARVELLQQKVAKQEGVVQSARDSTFRGATANYGAGFDALTQGDLLRFGSLTGRGIKSDVLNLLSGGRTGREGARDLADGEYILSVLRAQLAVAEGAPIGKSDLPATTNRTAPAATRRARAASGPTPVQIEKTYQNMLDELTQGELKAKRELTNTIEDRYQNQLDALRSDVAAKTADIAAAKGLTDAQRQTLGLALGRYMAAKQELEEARKADELLKQKNAMSAISAGADLEIMQAQEGMAKTAAERKTLQKQILDAELALLLAKEDEILASRTASAEEKALAQARRDAAVRLGQVKGQELEFNNRTPLETYFDSLSDPATKFQEAWVNALQNTENALVDFAMTGKLAFKDLVNSIIQDLIRVAIQQAIIKPLTGWFKGLFADGGAFVGGVQKFATGGVVSSPTYFPMRGGMGLMGEAGPEAIMPLRRLGNGRLGVEASNGGGNVNNVQVTVNVEGGQTQVSGDAGKAAQLGQLIGQAVRQELVAQKRPGGLLAA